MPQLRPADVLAAEPIGPYTLLRVRRGALDPGRPGQFFMLRPASALLPRPMSVCFARAGELAFLIDPVGPCTRALCTTERGDVITAFGPLGNGFDLRVRRPLLVGGGVGIAPLPHLSEALGGAPAVLGFRSEAHAEAASLLPGAAVVVDPTLVTDVLPDGRDLLACGPEAMLDAIGARWPTAQLAREAPMACGFGACYGCIVEIGGRLARLCLEGPVLRTA